MVAQLSQSESRCSRSLHGVCRGISEGIPQAIQVTDRWHLLVNLREALQRVLDRLRPELNALLPATFSAKLTLELNSIRPSSAEPGVPVARRLVWLFLHPYEKLDEEEVKLHQRLLNHAVFQQLATGV